MWKTGLIDGLVEQFWDPRPSALRGHVILVANVIRLTAESLPSGEYLPTVLASHALWKDFLPGLRYILYVLCDLNLFLLLLLLLLFIDVC